MTYAVVLASSLLAVVLALALAREARLRRALQALLARIFKHWRNADEANHSGKTSANPSGHGGVFLVDTGHVIVYCLGSGPTIHLARAAG